MADRLEVIQHITNLIVLSGIPARNRTDRQESDYRGSLEFVRNNLVDAYQIHYSKLEKALEAYELPQRQVDEVLLNTANLYDRALSPDKYILVDAINAVRSAMSSVNGLLEDCSIARDYFEGEQDRLDKIFSLFINTDKGWLANAFAEMLRSDSLNAKMADLNRCVELLSMRYDSLDKEFRALSRMLGAVMADDSVSERPKVIRESNKPFQQIVEK